MVWMPWMYSHWATDMQIRAWYPICKVGSVVFTAFYTTYKIHWFSQPGVGKYNVLRPVMFFHIPIAYLGIWCRLYLLCFWSLFAVYIGASPCLTFCYGNFPTQLWAISSDLPIFPSISSRKNFVSLSALVNISLSSSSLLLIIIILLSLSSSSSLHHHYYHSSLASHMLFRFILSFRVA